MHDIPDDLSIPAFLKTTTAGTPCPAVKKKREPKRQFGLPRTIEPAGLALLKQIETDKARKQKERFAMLRERYR